MLVQSNRFLQLILVVALGVFVTVSEARRARPVNLTVNTAATANISAGARVQMNFTAASAGMFVFASSNNVDVDPIAYARATGDDIIDDDGAGDLNFRFIRNMSARETFSFWAGVYGNEGAGTYSVTVTAAPPATTEKTLSLDVTETINIVSSRARISFTAPSAGTFLFKSSNNIDVDPTAYATAEDYEVIDDDGSVGNNFVFSRKLSAGETFVFYAGVYGNEGIGTYELTVKETAPATEALTLTLGTPASISIASSRAQVSFTAPHAGTFVFVSSVSSGDDIDPAAYASTEEYIDDDSAGDRNFMFEKTLSAGETFVFYAGVYGNEGVGSYEVTVNEHPGYGH